MQTLEKTKTSSITITKEEDEPPSRSGPLEISIKESKKEEGDSFFISKKILIKPEIKEKGFLISFNQKDFSVVYPRNIWGKYPLFLKKVLLENLTFALTLHLPCLLDIGSLWYLMSKPSVKDMIGEGFRDSLPATALMKSEKASKYLEKLSQTKYHFNRKEASVPFTLPLRKIRNTALIFFTFGKDSLLTYSLCKEIGIKTMPAYVKEPLSQTEDHLKEKLAEKFFEEFKQKILFIKNEAGSLREPYKNPSDDGWYGWEMQLTQFGLIVLPIAFARMTNYLFFSNEQSCNDKFLDKEGFWCNPVYEQSVEWIQKLGKIVQLLGMENLKVGSLIEPLHELAIIKILHHRYPEIAKYQMSCSSFNEYKIIKRKSRWCGNCSKCARIFIFLLANNINPKKVELRNNMLKLKYRQKYALFGCDKDSNYGYDVSLLGRDEQLLAFYLAYQNGYKGELIDLFKKLYLKEAKKREKELIKKYFGIHSAETIPEELKDKVLKIYKEELKI